MDVPAVAAALAEMVRELPGARLQIDVHHEVFDAGRALLRAGGRRRAAAPRGRARGRRAARARLLQRRRALGLPARARRVGAAVPLRHALGLAGGVLRPRHRGRRAELRVLRRAAAVLTYRHDEAGLDAGSLAAAVRALRAAPAHRARPWTSGASSAGRWRRTPGALRAAAAMSGCASGSSPPRGSRSPSRSPAVSRRTSGRWPTGCAARGHEVTLFAGPGSDPRLGVELLDLRRPRISAAARGRREHERARVARRAPRLPAADAAARAHGAPTSSTSSTTTACTTCRSRWPARCRSRCSPRCTRRRRRGWSRRSRSQERCPVTFVAGQPAHRRGVVAPRAGRARDPQRRRRRALAPGPGGGRRCGSGGSRRRRAPHLAIDAAVLAGRPLRLAGPDRGPRLLRAPRSGPRLARRASSTSATSPTPARPAGGRGLRRARDAVLGRAVRPGRRRGAGVRDAGLRVRARRAAGAARRRLRAAGRARATSRRWRRRSATRRGSRGRRRASTRCARARWSAMVDEYVELYGSLAAAPVA